MKMEPAVFFQYERVSDLLSYLGSGVKLKFNIDFGKKDKDGSKVLSMSEYKYSSDKYTNVSDLISVKRQFKPYLSLEYPINNKNGYFDGFTNNVFIPPSAILGLRERLSKFDKYIKKAFRLDKDKNLILIKENIVSSKSIPFTNNEIQVHQDLYYPPSNNKRIKEHPEIGVRMILNKEFSFTMSITSWKEFLYYIMTCDMYGWGIASADSFYSKMMGQFVSDISSSKSVFDKCENVTINRSKPVGREEKMNDFFK